MTGCLYVQPGGVSGEGCVLFLADTMASQRDSELPLITPASRLFASAKQPTHAKLARKLYFLGDRTIMAFAGDAEPIRRCLAACDGALPRLLSEPDPMGALAKLVNGYHPAVRAIAANLTTDGGWNFMSAAADRFETWLMGPCAAIGSGSATLQQRTESLDLDAACNSPHAVERALEHAKNLASICFAKEAGGELADWGACLEYAYADSQSMQWRRGPKTVHLIYTLCPIDNVHASVRDPWRLMAYDPGGGEGRLLSVSIDSEGRRLLEDLPIENMLDSSVALDRLGTREFWSYWQPERVSVAVQIPRTDGVVASLTQDFPADVATCAFLPTGVNVKLSDECFTAVARAAAEGAGFVLASEATAL